MFRKCWLRFSVVIVVSFIFLLSGLLVLAQGSGTLARITTASNSDRASFASFAPILSNDGNRLVFVSDSDFLNQGINDEQFEIWLYDTVALTLTRITTVSDNDRASRAPSPNGDGTRIVFLSDSDFLNQGINPGQDEVWLYDTQTMTLTRVTTAVPGNRRSFYPTISNDGTRVVFESDADFLGQGIVQNQLELWLYDTQTMTLTRITTATAPSRISLDPAFSLDGDWLAFASQSDLLNEGLFSLYRIWLYNTTNGTLTRVTDEPFGRGSRAPSLNGDGSQVVFHSDTDILNQGIPDEQNEIWLYDTQSVTFTRITVASDASRDSLRPRISEDGTKVVFYSDSDFLGQGLGDEQYEIWLYDTQTMTFTRVTSAAGADRASIQPSLSADGRRIAFQSDADFLNQAIPDDQDEIWLYQAPPQLSISAVGSDIELTWTEEPANQGFQVHRSSAPFFNPVSSTLLITLPTATAVYTDIGATGVLSPSYFYQVRSLRSQGQTADSNEVGAIDYAINNSGSMYSLVGLPFATAAISNAVSLASYVGGVSAVLKWNPSTQAFRIFVPPNTGDNFSLAPGEVIFVQVSNSGPGAVTMTGDVSAVQHSLNPGGFNFISLPLQRVDLTNAATTAADITNVNSMLSWNEATQTFRFFVPPNTGDNFSLQVGAPFVIELAAGGPSIWP